MQNAFKKLAVFIMIPFLLLTGCNVITGEDKLQDLGFTVVSEEKISPELMNLIAERKDAPFKLTYCDDDYLYIVIGYGEQEEGGYSIAVNNLYLTQDAIHVSTTLLKPGEELEQSSVSYPYIVLKLDYLDETVIFD